MSPELHEHGSWLAPGGHHYGSWQTTPTASDDRRAGPIVLSGLGGTMGGSRRHPRRHQGVAVDAGGVRESTMEAPASMPTPRKPLLCRLNMHHKWERRSTEDGKGYVKCTACGKDRYEVEI